MPTTLILVPGLLTDERLWSPQMEHLSDLTSPVVANVPTSDSVGGMARDILEWAPENFALAGPSLGGYIAMEIMRQVPERVNALALLDTSARADTREQTEARLELLKLAEADRFEGSEYQRILVPVFSTELGPEQAGERRLYTVANLYAATEASPDF